MKEKIKKISKNTKLYELAQDSDAVEILFSHGLGCMGCPMAQQETLEQGCLAHGINPDKIIKEINEKKKKKK